MSSWQQAAMVLAGCGVGTGIWLLLVPAPVRDPARPTAVASARAFLDGPGGLRVLAAVLAGLAVLVGTRWVAVAAAITGVILAWPALFGAAREHRAAITRLEALAAWVEALRDIIATGRGLAEAIPAASARSHPVLARPLGDVVSRMGAHEPIEPVLRRLADDIDDPAADQAIAALVLNARVHGRQLRAVLTGLAISTRREVETRRKVESDRRSMRRAVQIVMVVVAALTLGLATVARSYAEPYATVTGQLVLAVVVVVFLASFAWMRRLATYGTPARFLSAQHDSAPQVERVSWDGGLR